MRGKHLGYITGSLLIALVAITFPGPAAGETPAGIPWGEKIGAALKGIAERLGRRVTAMAEVGYLQKYGGFWRFFRRAYAAGLDLDQQSTELPGFADGHGHFRHPPGDLVEALERRSARVGRARPARHRGDVAE